jgi:hypothetical protein
VITFQLLYVLPSISHNSTDYVILTTPPKAPIAFNSPPKAPITFDSPLIDYDLIISDLIDSNLDLYIKLDALQVSRSYLQHIDELVRYRDPSDPDIQSLLFYYKELL